MIKKLFVAVMFTVVLSTATACSEKASPDTDTVSYTEYQLRKPQKGDTVAVFTTAEGLIRIRLFPEEAPRTVENFIKHVQDGYYNGLTFHRVLKDFMIQGGDPLGTGHGGESIWGTPFRDEFSPRLYNYRGALSMANAGEDTNRSQFFIVHKGSISDQEIAYLEYYHYLDEVTEKYRELGGAMWLDNQHTVFGQVYEGMEVVDKIAALPVKDPDSGEPEDDIIIEKIEIQTISE